MNPFTMFIIKHRKEYWPSRGSNQRPPVLKSSTGTLPTELCRLGNHPLYTLPCVITLKQMKNLHPGPSSPFILENVLSFTFDSLPNDKISDWSKFKALADDKINVTQNLKK